MELRGDLTEIIYQNEINSYTVAVLETEEEEFTVVGYLPFIHIGDTLNLIGKFVTHQEYGRQFKIDTFEKLMPQTLSSLERYLSNGAIKGIGPKLAKKIIDKFGEETISIFKFQPEKLANIKGITKEKAINMAEDFNENWELWQIVGFLEQFGIGVQNAKNVYKNLGVDALEEIRANPYILIDTANNIDFKQIDKIALNLGIEYNNDKRIRSGIKYALIKATNNGHCKVLEKELYKFVQNLLDVSEQEIENSLIQLKVKDEIIIDKENNETWIYLSYYYKAEETVAEKLLLLDSCKNIKKINNFTKEMKRIEKETNTFLSDKQKEALEAVNNNNVCVITGGPGTGKTTIIKAIIELYKKNGKKTVLCAPTGRAAKRMSAITGEEAMTLHRLLEIGKIEEEISLKTSNFDVAPIDADIVIIDEMSMVDLFLMNYVVKAVYLGTKLVLVGDIDQLPSVGPGSVLGDIIKSQKITTITLDKIFRQAAESKIIINSHRVNSGEKFITKEESSEELKEDFFLIPQIEQSQILEQVVSLCNGRLEKFGNYNFFKNIQVITPTKKGILGTKELNKTLQEKLNPSKEGLSEKQILGTIYRVGDRIMQIKNNYDIFWEKKEPKYETGSGVFNGEIGTIKYIDETEKKIKIVFDDEKISWYQFQDLDQIEHAYAITVHKAQRK